jgi:toxin ParE1/3/4
MLPVRWSDEANDDLGDILAYIGHFNPDAADALNDKIDAAVFPLSDHPYLGREGRVPGTREVIAHPNYIVVYRIGIREVLIVNVLHARQNYP